jgi:diaminopimelate decarboxylase
MKEKPVHAPMDQFPVINGELHIGGIPITRLAERVGQTPFYAYDRRLITERVQYLRDSLPKELRLHYAIKANPMPAVVQHLAGLVDGFDLASAGEMKIALDTTMPTTKISMAGPGKTDKELRQAIAAGITLNLESEGEMHRAAQIGEQLGITPRVAVRVNPDYELKSSGMKMGGGPKQFGVDAERVPAMLKEMAAMDLEFVGFHIFWGSQNLNPEAIMEAHEKTLNLAIRLSETANLQPHHLNIGGGLGIPYFPGETRLDLKPIGDNLNRLISAFKQKLPNTELITELGRFIVGEAGIYVCKVIDIKESRGEKFIVTDGGMHHHLAASGNFGQVIRKNYPVTIANKMGSTKKETISIVGPLCTPLDLLANKMELPHATIDDLVAIFQSGAYGITASPDKFLSHPATSEILL